MESVGASLSQANLVTGPATAAERALEDNYLSDDDEDAYTTSAEIDAFEKRMVKAGAVPPPPDSARTLPASAVPPQKPDVPIHLLHLLDSVKIDDSKPAT